MHVINNNTVEKSVSSRSCLPRINLRSHKVGNGLHFFWSAMQRQGSSSTRSGGSGGGYQNLREKIISLGLEIEDRQKLKQTLQFKVEEGKWI